VITFEQFQKNLKAAEVREYFQTLGVLAMDQVIIFQKYERSRSKAPDFVWEEMAELRIIPDDPKAWMFGTLGPSSSSWMKMAGAKSRLRKQKPSHRPSVLCQGVVG
jgi:hypothetical protein